MIRFASRLIPDQHAAAATEMALALPLLLVLIWGPLEIGNYFMDEHMLVKGVRDGAIYAAHQDITNFNCASNTINATVVTNTKNIVRSGALSGGVDRLRNWGSGSTAFTMSLTCVTAAGGTTLSGIYKINGGQVPVISINATVPYSPILGNLGFRPATLSLNATQQATVMGI
jgi:Flp pilus assembly protein TadG